jgi:hypothetical protein
MSSIPANNLSYSSILSHLPSDAAGNWMSYGLDLFYPNIDWESIYQESLSPTFENTTVIDTLATSAIQASSSNAPVIPIETRKYEGLGEYT